MRIFCWKLVYNQKEEEFFYSRNYESLEAFLTFMNKPRKPDWSKEDVDERNLIEATWYNPEWALFIENNGQRQYLSTIRMETKE